MSEAVQNYLKAIYTLRECGDSVEVSTQRLAQRLGTLGATVLPIIAALNVSLLYDTLGAFLTCQSQSAISTIP